MEKIIEHQLFNSGSIHSLNYDTVGEDRHISILYRRFEEMEKKVRDLEIKKIVDETNIPMEILESNGVIPNKLKKLKRGKGYRPILQSEIEEAKKHSPFAAAQARWLGISSDTFKKYAILYGIYEPKPNHKGKRNMFDPNRGKYPLQKILDGQFNDNLFVTDWMVKDKLIRSKTFLPKCNICGYDKRRIVDQKICLLLDHKDGNIRNFTLDNIQLLCLNCTFECGRGYIRSGEKNFDPDWMHGLDKDKINKSTRW